MKRFLCILVFCLFYQNVLAQSEDIKRFIIGIHYDTDVSGGRFSPFKLTQMAIDHGIDAVIFCDHDRMTVEYGLPPFRYLIKKRVEYPSVANYGFSRYLEMLGAINKKNPQITLIPAVEVAPAFYWSGNLFKKDLQLNNWHQHLMVIGLDKPEDYAKIPSPCANIREGRSKTIYYDIAAGIGIILGLLMIFYRVGKTVNFAGQQWRVKRRPYRFLGYILLLFCAVVLANDYPFTQRLFTPYQGDLNPSASQAVIDYTLQKGGLTFYSHPEAEFYGEIDKIKLVTKNYVHLLLETKDYTGFAVFAEGWQKAGIPGGEWDQALYQYCMGQREKSSWIIGEVQFEGNLPPEFLKEVATYIWAPNCDKKSVLEALARGKCYASQRWGPNLIWLDKWTITEPFGQEAISGETLSSAGNVVLHFNFTVVEDKEGFEASIIRNGRQLANVAFDETMTMDYEDAPPEGKNYYRLWVYYHGTPLLATNPIFVFKTSANDQ